MKEISSFQINLNLIKNWSSKFRIEICLDKFVNVPFILKVYDFSTYFQFQGIPTPYLIISSEVKYYGFMLNKVQI